jgi:hypothetical protein
MRLGAPHESRGAPSQIWRRLGGARGHPPETVPTAPAAVDGPIHAQVTSSPTLHTRIDLGNLLIRCTPDAGCQALAVEIEIVLDGAVCFRLRMRGLLVTAATPRSPSRRGNRLAWADLVPDDPTCELDGHPTSARRHVGGPGAGVGPASPEGGGRCSCRQRETVPRLLPEPGVHARMRECVGT